VVGEEEGQASALAVDRVPQELVPQEWAQAQGLELVPEPVAVPEQAREAVLAPEREKVPVQAVRAAEWDSQLGPVQVARAAASDSRQ